MKNKALGFYEGRSLNDPEVFIEKEIPIPICQAHDLLGRSLLKFRYFCAAQRRKSPRSACRKPCKARLPGHLIPFEAGGCPLELPRRNRAHISCNRGFSTS